MSRTVFCPSPSASYTKLGEAGLTARVKQGPAEIHGLPTCIIICERLIKITDEQHSAGALLMEHVSVGGQLLLHGCLWPLRLGGRNSWPRGRPMHDRHRRRAVHRERRRLGHHKALRLEPPVEGHAVDGN